MVRIRAVKYKGTGLKAKNQTYKKPVRVKGFKMKPGPAQKQKIRGPRVRGVKVKPKRRL